jgi:hypothetical protein
MPWTRSHGMRRLRLFRQTPMTKIEDYNSKIENLQNQFKNFCGNPTNIVENMRTYKNTKGNHCTCSDLIN